MNDSVTLATIYGLVDPRTDIVRYVGKTINPQLRLLNHLSNARQGKRLPVYNWIRKLTSLNLTVEMRALEVRPEHDWKDAERKWIEIHKASGKLLNLAEGGVGGLSGEMVSEETRRKLRASSTKLMQDPARRLHLVEVNTGKTYPPRTKEHSLRLSLANKGKKKTYFTDEMRRAKALILEKCRYVPRKRKPLSPEQREKVIADLQAPDVRRRAAYSKAKAYIVTFPDGTDVEIFNLKAFCRENSLDSGSMSKLCNSAGPKRTQHKGFRIRPALSPTTYLEVA